MNSNLNPEVTNFLKELDHPGIKEINLLRNIILGTEKTLTENIKWNGPNYSLNGEDRISMRIQPPKQLQLIFHRGAKKKDQPAGRLIEGFESILVWKENDRAVLTIESLERRLQ